MRGHGYRLMTELEVPLERPEVFALFSDAFRLEEITPPVLRFEVLTPPPIRMHQGQQIDYRLRLHGWSVFWKTEITDWDPPQRFVDAQIRGPYRRWVHTHEFEEVGGGTLIRDSVDYSVPGGAAVHWLLVRRDLERIFSYRQQKLPELLGVAPAGCRGGEVSIVKNAEAA